MKDLCAFTEFSVSPTNTSLYSLLLISNFSVSQAKKTPQGKETQQGKSHMRGKSHTKGLKCLTDTF